MGGEDITSRRNAIRELAQLFTYLGENPTEIQAFKEDQIGFLRGTSLRGEDKFIACFDLDRMNHHFVSGPDSTAIKSGVPVRRDLVALHPDGSHFVNTIRLKLTADFATKLLELDFETLPTKAPHPFMLPKCSVVYAMSVPADEGSAEQEPGETPQEEQYGDAIMQPKCSVVYIAWIPAEDQPYARTPEEPTKVPLEPKVIFHEAAKVITIGPRLKWPLQYKYGGGARDVYLSGFIDCNNGRLSFKFSE